MQVDEHKTLIGVYIWRFGLLFKTLPRTFGTDKKALGISGVSTNTFSYYDKRPSTVGSD